MKALLVQRNIEPPHTHNLVRPATVLRAEYPEFNADDDEHHVPYSAIGFRYPDVEAELEDAQTCFSLCQKYRERLLAHIKWDKNKSSHQRQDRR